MCRERVGGGCVGAHPRGGGCWGLPAVSSSRQHPRALPAWHLGLLGDVGGASTVLPRVCVRAEEARIKPSVTIQRLSWREGAQQSWGGLWWPYS